MMADLMAVSMVVMWVYWQVATSAVETAAQTASTMAASMADPTVYSTAVEKVAMMDGMRVVKKDYYLAAKLAAMLVVMLVY